jgi:hypothetical protein
MTFQPVVISSLSKEYIRVQMYAKEMGVEVNPTSYVVEFACTAIDANPISGDWKIGNWEVDGATYLARIAVGPGSVPAVVLAVGNYDVWVRITAPSETPVKKVGQLIVY